MTGAPKAVAIDETGLVMRPQSRNDGSAASPATDELRSLPALRWAHAARSRRTTVATAARPAPVGGQPPPILHALNDGLRPQTHHNDPIEHLTTHPPSWSSWPVGHRGRMKVDPGGVA